MRKELFVATELINCHIKIMFHVMTGDNNMPWLYEVIRISN